MFGLEDKKSKDGGDQFDLEKELKTVKKRRETLLKIEERIGQLKSVLRAGQSQEEFNDIGTLLMGYVALLKVVTRFGDKAK